MTDAEQDFIIERARVQRLAEMVSDRERRIEALRAELEKALATNRSATLEMENISNLCVDFQELGPHDKIEALRRVMVIKCLADKFLGKEWA